MEVHHAHASHGPKKFKEYITEFLMLFLAVTLGFFAENIREHLVEKERELKFITIVHEDLNNDIPSLEKRIAEFDLRLAREDSLLDILSSNQFQQTNDLYFLTRVTSIREFFNHSNIGFQQLKNAGGLRMIEDIDIIKQIQGYENAVERNDELQKLTDQLLMNYREKVTTIFDGTVFRTMRNKESTKGIYDRFFRPTNNPKLISYNHQAINELLVRTLYVNNNSRAIQASLKLLLKEAKELENALSIKYHLH